MPPNPKRGWTLLILSESGAEVRQHRVSRRKVVWGLSIVIAVVVVALVESLALFYYGRKAASVEPLTQRVTELEASEKEVARMGAELAELKSLEERIRRAMTASSADTSQSAPSYDSAPQDELGITPERSARPTFPDDAFKRSAPASSSERDFTSADLPTQPPVRGYVTRAYTPLTAFQSVAHSGMDIAAKEGTPVLAAADGIVLFSGWTYPYGYLVVIEHRTGYATYYGHNQIAFVSKGDRVLQGEPVALLGNSGRSTGAHLHFEIWQDGKPVNPATLIGG